MPFSSAAQKALKREPELLATLLTAGDDYEIVAAVPEASAAGFEAEAAAKGATLTMIGRIEGRCRRGEGGWSGRQDAHAGALGILPFLAPDQ